MLFALGVPDAIALALIVGLLDLIPLAGATIAAINAAGLRRPEAVTSGLVGGRPACEFPTCPG
jgi:predicted PurR-regulated permease PerM